MTPEEATKMLKEIANAFVKGTETERARCLAAVNQHCHGCDTTSGCKVGEAIESGEKVSI